MTFIHSILLGVVEGLTEFIPVSSTGHLILVSEWLRIHSAKTSVFEIFIQLGAILAVFILYFPKFIRLLSFKNAYGFEGLRGCFLLGLTSFPALALGWLAHGFIKEKLFNSGAVAIGLAVGGLLMLIAEARTRRQGLRQKQDLDAFIWKEALAIGLFQCLALWPGMSRSASTISGGMLLGINRKTAAEYSFIAAFPIISAAVIYDLHKNSSLIQASDLPIFLTGFAAAFFVAWFSIKTFLKILNQWTLKPFAWYRILLALIFFWIMYSRNHF